MDESEAESILEGWEKTWLDGIEDATKDFEHIEVSWYASRSLEDVISDASKSAYGFIATLWWLCFASSSSSEVSLRKVGNPGTCAGDFSHHRVHSERQLLWIRRVLRWVEVQRHHVAIMNDYFVFAKYVGICHGESPKAVVRAIHNQEGVQKSGCEHHGEFSDKFCSVLSRRDHADSSRSRVFHSSRHDCRV